MNFVFTGRCEVAGNSVRRHLLSEAAYEAGHTCGSSVTQAEDILVASRTDTAKVRQARYVGARVWTYTRFAEQVLSSPSTRMLGRSVFEVVVLRYRETGDITPSEREVVRYLRGAQIDPLDDVGAERRTPPLGGGEFLGRYAQRLREEEREVVRRAVVLSHPREVSAHFPPSKQPSATFAGSALGPRRRILDL